MNSIDLWYVTRATGIAALVLLTVTMVLGILVAGRVETSHPPVLRAETHRYVSVMTVVFLAIHVATSIADTYVHIGWAATIVPFTSSYDRLWVALGTVSVDLFLAVAVSSLVRQRIAASTWRLIHWLAYLSWPVAVAHTLGIGTDTKLVWMLVLVGLCIAAVVAAAVCRGSSALRARSSRPTTNFPPRTSLRRSRKALS